MNDNDSDCTLWWKKSGESTSCTYHSVPLCYNYGVKKVGICIVEGTGNFIGLEFDENINGHSCAGLGKDGYCWWFPRDCLERVPDEVVAIHCRVEIDEAL